MGPDKSRCSCSRKYKHVRRFSERGVLLEDLLDSTFQAIVIEEDLNTQPLENGGGIYGMKMVGRESNHVINNTSEEM